MMTQKIWIYALAVILAACQASDPSPDIKTPAQIHADILTLDSHVDIPLSYMIEIDPAGETDLQVDLVKLQSGGLDAAFFIVYTPQGELTSPGYEKAREIAQTRMSAIERMVSENAQNVELALTAADVRRIVASQKRAVMVGMENAYPLGETLTGLEAWGRRGVRYVGITHFGHNQFAESSNPHSERDAGQAGDQGLSDLGRKLIEALNEAGIMVDVSHAAKTSMMQAADLSTTPIIASHSGAKAIGDNPRNLDDEQLRKIAEVGGVAQMVAFDAYVKPFNPMQKAFQKALRTELGLETPAKRAVATEAIKAEYKERIKEMWEIAPRASLADFVDHIDHAVKIAGIEHVGIASDFDGGGGVAGWEDASQTANVTAELLKRGYSEADIAKLWGENLLRVMEAVEAAAK